MLLNPKHPDYFSELDGESRDLIKQIVNFFEAKGKDQLLREYYECKWYTDFLEFIAESQLFAKCLAPSQYDSGSYWNTRRNAAVTQTLAFYSVSHWYAWQVSILGLGPIWMGSNEAVKRHAMEELKKGGIFAFGLSEQAHGADIYSSSMALKPTGNGKYIANGRKYYIGNANAAAIVSTFARNTETGQYVFFATDRSKPGYTCVKNTVPWQGYVAEYELNGYEVSEDDILSVGDKAWDDFLNTVNVGKFNVGCASVGIASHCFHEAINHSATRILYGASVTDMPHIRRIFADAFARISAGQMYADRATDYMRCASSEDRRYLLFDPITKMKVSTECAQAINDMWDAIAARGFEKDMYFEQATKTVQKTVKLEGTVHVNMGLVVKFMESYLNKSQDYPDVPKITCTHQDDFLFDQGTTRGLGDIRFQDFRKTYDSVDLPNVNVFKEQINTFLEFLQLATPSPAQMKDVDYRLGVGELFTDIVYGHLILEQAALTKTDDDLVDYIFDVLVREFSEFALQLYSKHSTTDQQQKYCLGMIQKPTTDDATFETLWSEHVIAQKGAFEMNR